MILLVSNVNDGSDDEIDNNGYYVCRRCDLSLDDISFIINNGREKVLRRAIEEIEHVKSWLSSMCKISPLRSLLSILFSKVANLFCASDAPFFYIPQNILWKADFFPLK